MHTRLPFQSTEHRHFCLTFKYPRLLGNNCCLFQLERKYSGYGSHASCGHCRTLLRARAGARAGRAEDIRAVGSSPCSAWSGHNFGGHRSYPASLFYSEGVVFSGFWFSCSRFGEDTWVSELSIFLLLACVTCKIMGSNMIFPHGGTIFSSHRQSSCLSTSQMVWFLLSYIYFFI